MWAISRVRKAEGDNRNLEEELRSFSRPHCIRVRHAQSKRDAESKRERRGRVGGRSGNKKEEKDEDNARPHHQRPRP